MANPVITVRNYFLQSAAELKKVAWPSRDMTIRYSVLVVAVSVILAVFFAGLDFGLQTVVNIGLASAPSASAPSAATPPPVTPDLENTSGTPVDQSGKPSVDVQSESTPSSQAPADNNGSITLPPIQTPTK